MKIIKISGTIIPNDYKDVYDWIGIESTSPADVEAALDGVDEDVVFEINSGGGAIFAGSEIYSRIVKHEGEKRIDITGIAGSAASVIACAARSRIAPTGMVMIHNVSSIVAGDWQDMAHESDVLRECSRAIAGAYEQKTGKTEDELLELMNAETWMSAKEAVENGFVDEIMRTEPTNSYGRVLTNAEIEQARLEMKRAAEQEKVNILKLMEVRK